ncbi:hypothetical protein WJX73_010473 [Symbiochloris irregularis]|uniref:Uncharacterized protein n=1 Tax=Symbiochloris irregularis TaxID=706552 RepID=A0AAW1NPA4_9CHLO
MLAKVQNLAPRLLTDPMNPSTFSSCSRTDIVAAMFLNCPPDEYTASRDTAALRGDAYLQYRVNVSHFARVWVADKGSTVVFEDLDNSISVTVLVKGSKLTPRAGPLLECQFLCMLRRDSGPDPESSAAYRMVVPVGQWPTVLFRIELIEVLLTKEVLTANAARLSPEYKQRCKRDLRDQDVHDVSRRDIAARVAKKRIGHSTEHSATTAPRS